MENRLVMFYLYIFAICTITEISTQTVGSKIFKYFNSDTMEKFSNIWDEHRKSIENAISTALQESFGINGMNVFIRKDNANSLRRYFYDVNKVPLFLNDFHLKELPRFWKPYVSFLLPSNVLELETHVSKMILLGNYMLLRNKSDIVYELKDQNAAEIWPFLHEQVQPMGQLAITMESCIISGTVLTTLSGQSVNLEHVSFNISGCRYDVEIYQHGAGSPPVIVNYYPFRQGLGLDRFVLQTISAEFVPKLQAILFSVVNTSDIFKSELSHLINEQDAVLRASRALMSNIVSSLNNMTVLKNNGGTKLDKLAFIWDDTAGIEAVSTQNLTTEQIVFTGLQTLYSAHTGCPYKNRDVLIGDAIRFNTIQVRGWYCFKNAEMELTNYQWDGELLDVELDIAIGVATTGEVPYALKKFDVKGIRHMEYDMGEEVRRILLGYIHRTLFETLVAHVEGIFNEAVESIDGGDLDLKRERQHYSSGKGDSTKLMSEDELPEADVVLLDSSSDQQRLRSKAKPKPKNPRLRKKSSLKTNKIKKAGFRK